MNDNQQREWSKFVRDSIPGIAGELVFERLHGDGSARSFFRVNFWRDDGSSGTCVLNVSPEPPRHAARHVDENETWVYVASLLKRVGAGAPAVYGFDREAGLTLCEDLGDRLLQDEVLKHGEGSDWTREVYARLLQILAAVQTECGRSFEPERTFNPAYDADFIYEAESLYFAEFFLEKLCGTGPAPLHTELRLLAETAAESVGELVMIYRDFQSRNVIVQQPGARLRLLDFQGARMGPAAYDVASLLYDPYVNLPQELRNELVDNYPALLAPLAPVAATAFAESFRLVAVHRMMQALGAYGKLGLADGKREFLQWIPNALGNLRHLLNSGELDEFTRLRETVENVKLPADISAGKLNDKRKTP